MSATLIHLASTSTYRWLEDVQVDFRVGKKDLANVRFAVFGIGDSAYSEHFGTFARKVDRALYELGGSRLAPVVIGDQADDYSAFGGFQTKLSKSLSRYLAKNQEPVENVSGESPDYCSDDDDASFDGVGSEDEGLVDMEDLGKVMSSAKADAASKVKREMVTPALKKNLEKQRYTVVGSHSGVKVCRWTKSMLRGRGGCYKVFNLVLNRKSLILEFILSLNVCSTRSTELNRIGVWKQPLPLLARINASFVGDITPIPSEKNGNGKWMNRT